MSRRSTSSDGALLRSCKSFHSLNNSILLRTVVFHILLLPSSKTQIASAARPKSSIDNRPYISEYTDRLFKTSEQAICPARERPSTTPKRTSARWNPKNQKPTAEMYQLTATLLSSRLLTPFVKSFKVLNSYKLTSPT